MDPRRLCRWCGGRSKFVCRGCGKARYCSEECQKKHYRACHGFYCPPSPTSDAAPTETARPRFEELPRPFEKTEPKPKWKAETEPEAGPDLNNQYVRDEEDFYYRLWELDQRMQDFGMNAQDREKCTGMAIRQKHLLKSLLEDCMYKKGEMEISTWNEFALECNMQQAIIEHHARVNMGAKEQTPDERMFHLGEAIADELFKIAEFVVKIEEEAAEEIPPLDGLLVQEALKTPPEKRTNAQAIAWSQAWLKTIDKEFFGLTDADEIETEASVGGFFDGERTGSRILRRFKKSVRNSTAPYRHFLDGLFGKSIRLLADLPVTRPQLATVSVSVVLLVGLVVVFRQGSPMATWLYSGGDATGLKLAAAETDAEIHVIESLFQNISTTMREMEDWVNMKYTGWDPDVVCDMITRVHNNMTCDGFGAIYDPLCKYLGKIVGGPEFDMHLDLCNDGPTLEQLEGIVQSISKLSTTVGATASATLVAATMKAYNAFKNIYVNHNATFAELSRHTKTVIKMNEGVQSLKTTVGMEELVRNSLRSSNFAFLNSLVNCSFFMNVVSATSIFEQIFTGALTGERIPSGSLILQSAELMTSAYINFIFVASFRKITTSIRSGLSERQIKAGKDMDERCRSFADNNITTNARYRSTAEKYLGNYKKARTKYTLYALANWFPMIGCIIMDIPRLAPVAAVTCALTDTLIYAGAGPWAGLGVLAVGPTYEFLEQTVSRYPTVQACAELAGMTNLMDKVTNILKSAVPSVTLPYLFTYGMFELLSHTTDQNVPDEFKPTLPLLQQWATMTYGSAYSLANYLKYVLK